MQHTARPGPTTTSTVDVDNDTYLAIQRFLYREAAILYCRDYRGWLSLLTDDVIYRVSAQVNRDADVGPLSYAIIDETAARLKARLEQVANAKLTHAENPPTLTRRMISNVLAACGGRDNEFIVTSNLLIFRTRPEMPEGALYAGERTDILRRVNGPLADRTARGRARSCRAPRKRQHAILTVSRIEHSRALMAEREKWTRSTAARRRELRISRDRRQRSRTHRRLSPRTRRALKHGLAPLKAADGSAAEARSAARATLGGAGQSLCRTILGSSARARRGRALWSAGWLYRCRRRLSQRASGAER